jgi:hypothetical protein
VVVNMQWWLYIVVVGVLALGIFSFVSLVRWRTRWMTTKTTRTAEDMYDQYADRPPGRHRRSLVANEFQCQPGHYKGCEKDRQEPLSGASEGDDLFLGGVEGLSAARISSIANLQGVTSGLDWYLDRVVHFDRPNPLTVDHDIVRATTDLRSD